MTYLLESSLSSSQPLVANDSFVSPWFPMAASANERLMVVLNTDQIVASARLEWSGDGTIVTSSDEIITDYSPVSNGGGISNMFTASDEWVRVVVENAGTDQTFLELRTFVATSTAHAAPLKPVGTYPADKDASTTVRAVLYGRRAAPGDPVYTQVLVDGGGRLLIGQGTLPTSNFGQRIAASLVSAPIFSLFPDLRDSLSIFNSSTVGNLYIRLALDVDVAFGDWDYKILPGGMWVAPRWGGDVYLAWDDDSDGFAHVQEVYGA